MKKSIKNKIQGLRTIAGVLLCFLMVISLVPTSLTAKAAANKKESASQIKLEKKEGTVTVTSSAGKSQSVRSGMRLYSGSHVKTGQKSSVWLSLDNSKAAKIDSNSDIEFRKRGNKLELMIHSGRIFFSVAEKLKNNETMNIKTSNATTGVRGTDGWADTDSTGLLTGKIKLTITDPVTGKVVVKWVEAGQALSGLEGARKTPEKVDLSYLKATLIRGDQAPAIVPEVLIEQPQICERAKQNLDRFGFDIDEMIASAAEKRAKEDAEAAKKAEQIADEIAKNQPETQEEKIPTFKEETVEDPGPADTTVVEPSGGGGYVPDPTPTTFANVFFGSFSNVTTSNISGYTSISQESSYTEYVVGNGRSLSFTATLAEGYYAGDDFGFDAWCYPDESQQQSDPMMSDGFAATVSHTPVSGSTNSFNCVFNVPNNAHSSVQIRLVGGVYSSTGNSCSIMVPSTTTAITSVVVKEKFGSGSYETLTPNGEGRVTVNQGHTLQIIATAASGYSWRADSDVSFDFGCATLSSKNATPTTFTVTAVANDTGRITIDDPVSTITGVLSDGMFSIYAAGSNSTMPPGTTYDLSHTPSISALLGSAASSVTSVTVVDSVAPKGTMSWFSGLSNLTTITGLDNVGVSQVNDFTGLFKNCSSLTTVNIGGISSLATSAVLDEMFYGCSALAIIHANMDTDWSTSSYTGSSEDMFTGCTALQNALHDRQEIEITEMPTDKSYARIDDGSGVPGYFTGQ